MTDQEQQRADHLALVAAPIFAAFWGYIRDCPKEDMDKAAVFALHLAEKLQRAADERVSHE